MRPLLGTIFASLCAGATLASCADSTGPGASGRQPMSLSFSTSASAGASASLSASAGNASTGADVLVITRAQLVLARLELERVGATCTSDAAAGDDDHGDDDKCAELELAPSVVDLPVKGGVVTALNVTVPAGTYSSFEAKIRPVEANHGSKGAGSAAFLAAHPDLAGVSVRVEGTFNGTAFTYTGSPHAKLESAFNPPLAVTSTGANITVHVDLATWFKTASGAFIDPATGNAGRANAALISENIKRSFHAFRDNDHNGDDDDRGAGHS